MKLERCSACGSPDHKSRPDGLCSSTGLAAAAVMGGMPMSDAALEYGISAWNIGRAVARISGRDAPSESDLKEWRRRAIATWVRQRDALIRKRDASSQAAVLDWPPPEVVCAPAVDVTDAMHDEVPDPECLVGMGWRTRRRRP